MKTIYIAALLTFCNAAAAHAIGSLWQIAYENGAMLTDTQYDVCMRNMAELPSEQKLTIDCTQASLANVSLGELSPASGGAATETPQVALATQESVVPDFIYLVPGGFPSRDNPGSNQLLPGSITACSGVTCGFDMGGSIPVTPPLSPSLASASPVACNGVTCGFNPGGSIVAAP